MSEFTIVNDFNDIKLPIEWKDSYSNKIVDPDGNLVSPNYQGHQYRLIKKVREFSCPEKFARRFLGVLVLIVTFGIAYFKFETVRNLILKTKETRRYGVLIVEKNDIPQEKDKNGETLNLVLHITNTSSKLNDISKKSLPLSKEDTIHKISLEKNKIEEKQNRVSIPDHQVKETTTSPKKDLSIVKNDVNNSIPIDDNKIDVSYSSNKANDTAAINPPAIKDELQNSFTAKDKIETLSSPPIPIEKEPKKSNDDVKTELTPEPKPVEAVPAEVNRENDPPFQIFIRTLTGNTVALFVKKTDTINHIKEMIQEVWGVPVSEQSLIGNCKYLVGNRTLADYNIVYHSITLHLSITTMGD